jgi:hypothetical protein
MRINKIPTPASRPGLFALSVRRSTADERGSDHAVAPLDFLRRVAWETEKNLSRLASQWSRALGISITALANTARAHLETQQRTLSSLLAMETPDPVAWEEAHSRLDAASCEGSR